jgi:hypothetical protein
VRQKWLTRIFVAGDVFSFMLQAAGAYALVPMSTRTNDALGGGIQAIGTLSSLHTGEKIVIAGLFAQLGFFAGFVLVAGVFHYRLVKDKPLQKRTRKDQASPSLGDGPWKRHLYNLYVTSGLIVVRSIFRIVEYVQGIAGYLLSHEVFLYVFDAVLMVVVMVLFNWVHPSEVTEAYEKRRVDSGAVEAQVGGGHAEREAEEERREK